MSDGAWLNGTLNYDRSKYHNHKDTHYTINFQHPRTSERHFKKLSLIPIVLSRICFLRRGLVSSKDPGWHRARCHAGLKLPAAHLQVAVRLMIIYIDDLWRPSTGIHYIILYSLLLPMATSHRIFFTSVFLFAFCFALLAWYHVSFRTPSNFL